MEGRVLGEYGKIYGKVMNAARQRCEHFYSMGVAPVGGAFWQLIKYGVVGVLATVVQLTAFYIFATCVFQCLTVDDWAVKKFGLASADVSELVRGINFVVCALVGFVVSNFVCWLLNRTIVFKTGKFSWYVELGMFYAASATAAFLAIGLSWLCINCLGLMTTLAVFIEIVVSFAINYFVRKFFIFKG